MKFFSSSSGCHYSDIPVFRHLITPKNVIFCRDNAVSEQWDYHCDRPTFRQLFKCSYCNVLFIIILDLVFSYRVAVEVYLADILVHFNRISYAFQIYKSLASNNKYQKQNNVKYSPDCNNTEWGWRMEVSDVKYE